MLYNDSTILDCIIFAVQLGVSWDGVHGRDRAGATCDCRATCDVARVLRASFYVQLI